MVKSHLQQNHIDWQPMMLPDFAALSCSGIYFLYESGEVVYVGQAVCIRSRVGQHISEGLKKFDAVAFRRCQPTELRRLERKFIELLKPRYNKCSIANQAKTSVSAPDIFIAIPANEAHSYFGVSSLEFADIAISPGFPKVRKMPRTRELFYKESDLTAFIHSSRE